MGERIYAKVKPELLEWARTSAGYDIESAAAKLKITVERLGKWEDGTEAPTIPQLRKIGDLYKRPIAVFFLPQPPKDFDALRDFRRLPESELGEYSVELKLEIRRVQERRNAALDLAEDLGMELKEHSPMVSLKNNAQKAASKLRQILNVDLQTQAAWHDEREALRSWIAAVEEQDILVFQTSSVLVDEMRGFAISEKLLPVIVLNGKDSPHGRIFTLIHEYVHIALGESGVSSVLGGGDDFGQEQRMEQFCNAVAAELLVPLTDITGSETVVLHGNDPQWDDDELSALSRIYSVSREVVLRRLLESGLTNADFYKKMRRLWMSHTPTKTESKGGPAYPTVPVRNLGNYFITLGLEAYHSGLITARDVSGLFNMKIKHLGRVEEMVLGQLA